MWSGSPTTEMPASEGTGLSQTEALTVCAGSGLRWPWRGSYLESQVGLGQQQPSRLAQVQLQQGLGLEQPQLRVGRSVQAPPGLSVYLQDLEDAAVLTPLTVPAP